MFAWNYVNTLWADHRARVVFYYGAIGFCSSMMDNLYMYYSVDLYVNLYKLDMFWFYTAQTLFMVWNAINDPIIGWFASAAALKETPARRHLQAFWIGGPIYALAFLVHVFPLDSYMDGTQAPWVTGMHYLLSLFFWDGMYTYVVLEHCALLPDLSYSATHRAAFSLSNTIFGTIGGVSLALSSFLWQPGSLGRFRLLCLALAGLAALGFRFAATKIAAHREIIDSEDNRGRPAVPVDAQPTPLPTFLRQLLKHRNFFVFVATNFFHVLHANFVTAFFVIFARQLLRTGRNVDPATATGYMLSATGVMIWLVNVVLTTLNARVGAHRALNWVFIAKIIVPAVAWAMGVQFLSIALLFILNTSTTNAIWSLLTLAIGDLIDEDQANHKRPTSMSSTYYGFNALFTKPAQSLAPMITMYVLNSAGYVPPPATPPARGPEEDFSPNIALQRTMFMTMIWYPVVCGAIQLLIWSQYTLRGEHLASVRRRLESHDSEDRS